MASPSKVAPSAPVTVKKQIVKVHVKFTLNTPDGKRRVIFISKRTPVTMALSPGRSNSNSSSVRRSPSRSGTQSSILRSKSIRS